jgi:hypothetical protein
MDLVEKDDHLELRADLPGMSEDDVDIEVKDGVLTISGERKTEQEETREGYRRVERAFGRRTGGAAPAPPTLGRCGGTRPGSALMSRPVTATPVRA